MSILDQIKPVSETVESVNALVYGQSGSGKTVFGGSGTERDLIVAIEHGTSSAARQGSKASVIDIRTWDELDELVTALTDDPERFDWIIIDSLTKMQDLIWEDILDNAVRNSPNRSPYKRELQEYGEAQMRLTSIVERLNGSDANVIYIALSELQTDEEANEFQMPSIHGQGGKLSAWVCAQMDIVCYISVARDRERNTFRKFQFNKSPEVFAKDRFDIFRNPVKNLTLQRLTDKLQEGSVQAEEEETKTNKNDQEN